MNIQEQIIEMLKRVVEDEFVLKDLSLDTDLIETGIMDSLVIAQLIMEMEETFPIGELDVDDIILENFSSIAAIVALIEKRVKK